jgi:hypothetical protein
MKLTVASIFLGLLAALLGGAAFGSPPPASHVTAMPSPSPTRLIDMAIMQRPKDRTGVTRQPSEETQRQIAQLRAEGLLLQQADGGSLTREHHAYLQRKLDAILTNAH